MSECADVVDRDVVDGKGSELLVVERTLEWEVGDRLVGSPL